MEWGIKPETKIKETLKCQDVTDLSFENSLKIKYIKISMIWLQLHLQLSSQNVLYKTRSSCLSPDSPFQELDNSYVQVMSAFPTLGESFVRYSWTA